MEVINLERVLRTFATQNKMHFWISSIITDVS